MSIGSCLSWFLLLRELSLLLLPLQMVLDDRASPVIEALFQATKLLVNDVIFEGRFHNYCLLAIGLVHGAFDFPLFVRVVNSENLFAGSSPLVLGGLDNRLRKLGDLASVITLLVLLFI